MAGCIFLADMIPLDNKQIIFQTEYAMPGQLWSAFEITNPKVYHPLAINLYTTEHKRFIDEI